MRLELKNTSKRYAQLVVCAIAAFLFTIPTYAQEGSLSEGGSTPVPGGEPPVATFVVPQASVEPMYVPDGTAILPPESGVFPPDALIVDPAGTVDTGEACPNPLTSATYNDIQAAINCAVDGGTVGVNAGTYVEALTIAKNLTLMGASAKTVTVDANDVDSVMIVDAPVTVYLVDLTLYNGTSPLYGGGIYVNAATVYLDQVHLSTNRSNGDGGGIYTIAGTITLLNSTLSNNMSVNSNGGSIVSQGSTINVINTTISGGQAAGTGGGIMTRGGTLNIVNSTLNANARPQLFGSNAMVTLSNTIIANGTGSMGSSHGECGTLLTMTSLGNNLASDNSCGLIQATDKPNTNPLLGVLADNGGTTPTHAPALNSPAVDAGNNTVCAAAPVNSRDQIGTSRPQGAVCDIGAVEVGSYGANLLENGTFDAPIGSADSNWGIFPNEFVGQITGGVFEFYSPVAGGVVLQRSGDALPAGTGVEVSFDLGNSSGVRKRATVIAWDSTFADLRVCTFWLPPGTALRPYRMQFRTTQAWANAQLSFYASTVDSASAYRLDNVVMRTDSSVTQDITRCTDPGTPTAGSGADGAELITNGNFATGITNWGLFNPAGNFVQNGASNGVFEFYLSGTSGQQAPSLLQNTNVTTVSANALLELRFDLGNSSGQWMRVTPLLHASNFGDLQVCTFWLAPNTPIGMYVMRTYTSGAWTAGASVSFYPSSAFAADPGGRARLDNVSLKVRPSLNITGTTCYTPGTASADVGGFVDDAAPIFAPTLMPTATPYAAPAVQAEQPLIATPTPTLLPDTSEGSITEGS
jgi:hypothetical protein